MPAGDSGKEQFRRAIVEFRNLHVVAALGPLFDFRSEVVSNDEFGVRGGLDNTTKKHYIAHLLTCDRMRRRVTYNPERLALGELIERATDSNQSLQMPEGAAAPEVGDVVIDTQGNHWTILTTEHHALLGRWQCSTRELRLAAGCDDVVDVERAVWQDFGDGPEITGWTDVYTALPVKIQPDENTASNASNMPNVATRFTFILGDHFPIQADDRFVGADGSIYRLRSVEQQERLDKLPIAVMERVST